MSEFVSIWTNERVKRLLELFDKGLSSAKISKVLLEEAGFRITRNSVISKLNRLGKRLSHKKAEVKAIVVHTPKTIKHGIARLPAEVALHGTSAVLGLRRNQCRWPIGETTDKDFCFCSKDAASGRSYCLEHTGLAYVPIKRRLQTRGYQQR